MHRLSQEVNKYAYLSIEYVYNLFTCMKLSRTNENAENHKCYMNVYISYLKSNLLAK